MKDISQALSREEARDWALANIDAFDRVRFLTWLGTTTRATQELAMLCPPDKLYELPGGSVCVVEGYHSGLVGVRLLGPGARQLFVAAGTLTDVTSRERRSAARTV